jgi:hypothetical protein
VNVAEALLVFVGAPLAIVAVLALLIFVPGGRKRPRYKSGQPWTHAPVWYEPHPEHGPAAGHGGGDAHGATAISQHGSAAAAPSSAGPLGGARGTW